jgi:uncharacterized protein YecT (DUF1311 family)
LARRQAFVFLFPFITGFPSFPAYSQDYDWSSDVAAINSSRRVSEECLSASLPSERYICIGKSAEICRKNYGGGKDTQYTINQCVGFAVLAWESIPENIYERLMNLGESPEDIAKSQAAWKAWNDLDCRAVAGYIGTRSAMDYGSCRLRHAAHRVFDLTQLIPSQSGSRQR